MISTNNKVFRNAQNPRFSNKFLQNAEIEKPAQFSDPITKTIHKAKPWKSTTLIISIKVAILVKAQKPHKVFWVHVSFKRSPKANKNTHDKCVPWVDMRRTTRERRKLWLTHYGTVIGKGALILENESWRLNSVAKWLISCLPSYQFLRNASWLLSVDQSQSSWKIPAKTVRFRLA